MDIQELNTSQYKELEKKFNIHPLQSYAWGEVKRAQWQPVRLGIYDGKRCIAVVSILTKAIPLYGKYFGYIPRGIALFEEGYSEQVGKEVTQYARQNLAFVLVDLEKYVKGEGKDDLERSLKGAGFQAKGKQVQHSRTVVLDLSKSEEELLSDMRSKHRQYIRKAQRLGVRIRQGGTKDIDSFCRIMRLIAQQRGYLLHDASYYAKVWQKFSQDGSACLFLGEHESEVVGSYMVLLSKEGAYEMYGGCDQKGNKLLANYIMKWEAIRYCKQLGKTWYDQWGAEYQYPGLVQFKEGFGGEVVEYPLQYVYIADKIAFKIYQVFEKVNKLRQRVGRVRGN